MKEMIVYYSRPGENYVSGSIRDLKIGNTQRAADLLAKITKAPMFELEQEKPYDFDYNKCIEEARQDQRKNTRPALKRMPEGVDEADVIWLGYPIYWNTMPMAVFTFLDQVDLKGKEIRPFCTHEGSGLGSSVSDLRKNYPDAVVRDGLAIFGTTIEKARPQIQQWADSFKN